MQHHGYGPQAFSGASHEGESNAEVLLLKQDMNELRNEMRAGMSQLLAHIKQPDSGRTAATPPDPPDPLGC